MHQNEKHNFPHPWCRKQIVRAVLVRGTCQNRRIVFPLRMPLNCTDVSSNHRTAELIALDILALHVFSPAYWSFRRHNDAPHTVDVSSVWLTNSCYGGQVYLKQLHDSCLLWSHAGSLATIWEQGHRQRDSFDCSRWRSPSGLWEFPWQELGVGCKVAPHNPLPHLTFEIATASSSSTFLLLAATRA